METVKMIGDFGALVVLAGIVIMAMIIGLTKLPALFEQAIQTWKDMTTALANQNAVTARNSEFIETSMAVHLRWEADLDEIKAERERARGEREKVATTIKNLTAEIEALKQKIDDGATKEDVKRIEEQVIVLQQQIEELIPFLKSRAN